MRLKVPKAVLEARESQKGMHWTLEVFVFAAVFLVSAFGEAIVLMPVQMSLLLKDPDYADAAAANDLERLTEIAAGTAGNHVYMIASLFATAVMIAIVVLFCRLVQKRKLSSLGFVKKEAGIDYFRGVLLGFGMFSAAALICALTGAIRLSPARGAFSLSTLFLYAVGYMAQGMAEEALCRGYFMVSLGRRYSMELAVLANAVAFGALHALNPGISPLAVFNIILFGIFASLCFIRTENIWLVGALHSVWNFAQGNIYGIKVSGLETGNSVFSSVMTEGRELFHGGEFGLEGGLAVTIVLIAGIALLFLYKKDKGGIMAERGTA